MLGRKTRCFAPLDDRSLEELVPADNIYRRLQRVLDLSFVHDLVADCYAAGGRPSVDPVVFFKLRLVMFLEGIRSERQLMRVVAGRISVRWYLGYDLDESLPDHSSLTRIRDCHGVEIFRRFFDAIVERCREAGLVWGRELFFDASKIEANASVASLGPILAALVTSAEVMENTPMLDLLWHSRFRWHIRPHHVTGDTTYRTIQNNTAIDREGIRAYISLPNYEQRTAFFPKSTFTYEPECDVYICPQEEQLRPYSYSRTDRQIKYRADKKICNRCPLKEQCTTGKAGRKVERSFDDEYVERVRSYQETESYKKAIHKRQVWIEPLFGEAKDWHGKRWFRLRRLAKVKIEALVVASGQNIKRLLTMQGWGWHPRSGGERVVALTPSFPRVIAWSSAMIRQIELRNILFARSC